MEREGVDEGGKGGDDHWKKWMHATPSNDGACDNPQKGRESREMEAVSPSVHGKTDKRRQDDGED